MVQVLVLLAVICVLVVSAADEAKSAPPAADAPAAVAVCVNPDEHSTIVAEMKSMSETLKLKEVQLKQDQASCVAKLDKSSEENDRTQKEFETCLNESNVLVSKMKKHEALIKSMDASNKKTESEVAQCESRLSEAGKVSDILAQCEKKVEALRDVETHIDSCKLNLTSTKDELAKKEKSFVEDLKVLRQMLEKGEAQRKVAVAQSEDRSKQLSELQLEMRKTRALADEANESKLVFSVAQLQANLQKLVVVSSALSRFACDKIHAAIPATVFDSISLYKAQAKVAVWNAYDKVHPHVEVVTAHVTTGQIVVRRLYAEHAASRVQTAIELADVNRRASNLWSVGMEFAGKYIVIGNALIDDYFIAPLVKDYPQVASHIPTAPFDRLAALGYALFIIYIASRVVRVLFLYGLKPTCRAAWCLITMPIKIPMCICRRLCCGKKTSPCNKKRTPAVKSEIEEATKTKKTPTPVAKQSAPSGQKNKKN